jgi:hypothetical protein
MITAKLRHRGAVPEDIDYIARRSLDKALFQQMLTGRWIKDKRNLMLTGPCSVGKTWLACALAQAACRHDITVIYKRIPRLFDELELAHCPSHALPASGRTRSMPVQSPHQNPTADPPLSLIAFAINERAMDDWALTAAMQASAAI